MDSVKDTGPLDWRIAIVGQDGRPTPEFQRRWSTQRNNNSLIGALTLGTGVPPASPIPADGAEYIDKSTTPYTMYVGNGNIWHRVGVLNFTELKDVPHSYTANAGKFIQVNAGATGLQFGTAITSITAGVGLSGGTITGTGTIDMANTAVTPGSYTSTNLTVDAQGRITTAANGSGGGSGYPAGTPPTIVQVAHATSSTAVTFGVAPTNGNLLVAMSFNPTGNTAQVGWTKQLEDASGTDWNNICTKICGAGEPVLQQAITTSASGGVVMWELHKGVGTPTFVSGFTGTQFITNFVITTPQPCVKDCISLAATGLLTAVTFSTPLTIGTQDVLDNTGSRRILAVHGDLSQAPVMAALSGFSAPGTHKTCIGTFK